MKIENVIGFDAEGIDFDFMEMLFSLKKQVHSGVRIVSGLDSDSDFSAKIQTPINEMPKPTPKSVEDWILKNPRYFLMAVMEAT